MSPIYIAYPDDCRAEECINVTGKTPFLFQLMNFETTEGGLTASD